MRQDEQDVLVLALEVTSKELEPPRCHSSGVHGLPHLRPGYRSSGTLPAQTWKVSTKFQLTNGFYYTQPQRRLFILCVCMCVDIYIERAEQI